MAPEDIWRYYDDADIYIQTPDIDNMPSSVLEAYSSGLPVVADRVGGVPAILTTRSTVFWRRQTMPTASAAQVVRLLEDPPLSRRLVLAAYR